MAEHWNKIVNVTMRMMKEFAGNKLKLSTSPIVRAKAAAAESGPSRKMKFPYTLTAKIVQFPWVYYFKNNWVYRYYFISVILCLPIFKKISNVFNSPTNVKKWEEIRRKEREEEHHRH